MGLVVSRIWRKKTTADILETLEKDINKIENYSKHAEQKHKKIGRIILFFMLLYFLTAFLFYFYFFPANIYDQLFYIIPLISAPVIIMFVKWVFAWYYNRKISRNQLKLKSLKEEKKKMLDKVMETETYKVAKVILEKYAPEHVRKSVVPASTTEFTPSRSSSIVAVSSSSTTTGLRQRMLPVSSHLSRASYGGTPGPSRTPYFSSSAAAMQSSANITPGSALLNNPGTPLPMPRAILPRERSVLDKMVDYLIGDGPANRYALICRQCFSHNGMAVREEFEYISFRCCYCYHFNPARKKRPIAPKLNLESTKTPTISKFSSSDTDKSSSSESDTDSGTGKTRTAVLDSPDTALSDFDRLSDEIPTWKNDDSPAVEEVRSDNPFESDSESPETKGAGAALEKGEDVTNSNPFETGKESPIPVSDSLAKEDVQEVVEK